MPPVENQFQHHEPGADDDCGVRDVERVPVVVADVKVDEVGDALPQHAVDHVSRRAAQNQA